jgi:hypothetical protein
MNKFCSGYKQFLYCAQQNVFTLDMVTEIAAERTTGDGTLHEQQVTSVSAAAVPCKVQRFILA